MKVIFLPGTPLCGVCGNVLLMKRNLSAPTPATHVTVYCAMLTCPERRKRYTLELDVRELQPAPTAEQDGGEHAPS